jgi:DNA-directed RNA polymerase specialized sigma24 family protein
VPANAATSVGNSSDEILVERIEAGDKLAMQVLFARHRTKLYRWLLRFVGDETVAEDLLSDVFFDVWRQAGRMLSIARFKALSARRRRIDVELDETIERLWPTVRMIRKSLSRRRAAPSLSAKQ